MSDFTAPEIAWGPMLPVLVVLVAAVVGVLVEAFVPAARRRVVQVALTLASLAGALLAVAALWNDVELTGGTDVLGGSLVVDGPTLVLQATIALLALLSTLLFADRVAGGEDAFAPSVAAVPGSDYEEIARSKGLRQTEVYPLLLFATGGMMIFPATTDLLMLFVALEVLSLPLYLLSGMARRRRLLSQEASMKYFLLGAFVSAVMLFGIGLLYGYSGSLRYADIAAATATPNGMEGLLVVGSLLLLAGLFFKVGAVPFHMWTPDVYQGAPTPVTGFMAACTKVAAFGALLRVVYGMLPGMAWDLEVVLWVVAIITMVVGTVAALVQTDVKRLLAYSSIAHAGFVLTGVVALQDSGITAVLFYLLAYGATTVGAFGLVSLVRERGTGDDDAPAVLGEATRLSQWAGLGRTHPVVAVTFTLFLLSFAGIPLTAGFVGKFAVFSAAVEGGAWPLALIGVLASAAAAFFYVRIIVLMFFTESDDATGTVRGEVSSLTPDAPAAPVGGTDEETLARPAVATVEAERTTRATVVGGEGLTVVAVAVCALLTVVLGVAPSPVLDAIASVAVLLP
ncbi:NADH-quinone oxidoreductase subunit NuoN [Cellulomonas xiejunii]|uniref:NADH-quinone oxidoreductase subunit N n=1 Tax=Cellulomonas xiejunii TaxID=2968083 RepID=A0ABY5KKH3_9CELL|nr:NADH-quinone oxidoreductase subunit NuoN [Cellulomonas xiejunii]MCC2316241.1 NADH-quinone oxidoreductase subunit NuoN [Cellulomonas xiejunii]MCC2320542.1 NADH-quinone oxidoreductase subunit NuoN [Cellulomonas xiejunii]UUI70835.1 NADH-quinone oxidoreductase subunit NuoN [Cellulomonas xiejunii]